MVNTGRHPDIADLQKFPVLVDLTPEQLSLLTHAVQVYSALKGERLIEFGSTDPYSFFLLKGTVKLHAPDGGSSTITAGTDNARYPIAQLLPRRYDVFALNEIECLKVDHLLLREISDNRVDIRGAAGVNLAIVPGDTAESEHELEIKIREDLDRDRLMLPSLPEFAIRIGRALEDEVADADYIAKIIQTDPAITAKLVRAANCVLYAGREPVDTCSGAIVRLGVNTTHKLVLSFALRELFSSRNFLMQKYMHQLWYHSAEVAALCFILARLTKKFDPEHALLTGLMHDIGIIAIISYVEKYPALIDDEHELDHAINLLRGIAGKRILEKWEFPKDLVIAAAEAEDWERDHSPEPDICDLVIIAQLHSYVGTPLMQKHPSMVDLPCFSKLELGELSPQMSLKILDEAVDQVAQAEMLLK